MKSKIGNFLNFYS